MHTSKDSATSWQTEEQNAPNFTAQDCNTKTSTIQNYSDFAGEHISKIQLQFFCLVLHNNVTQENFAYHTYCSSILQSWTHVNPCLSTSLKSKYLECGNFLSPNQQCQNSVGNLCVWSQSNAVFELIVNYLSTVADFHLPYLHFTTPLRVTPVEFCGDLWHQKSRVSALLCGSVSMILHLAICNL